MAALLNVFGQQVCHGLERLADRHTRCCPRLAQLDGFDHEDDGGCVAFEQGVERHGERHCDLVRIAAAIKNGCDEISGLHGDGPCGGVKRMLDGWRSRGNSQTLAYRIFDQRSRPPAKREQRRRRRPKPRTDGMDRPHRMSIAAFTRPSGWGS
ncbi:hypothetical protein SDC9_110148 [bioreactor metagenome]|uniref:Uncharacterized protein n=1 Tax=bioreactor metagenome TaxID=1076179 RepID=A0A645BDY8_9ZZZZ